MMKQRLAAIRTTEERLQSRNREITHREVRDAFCRALTLRERTLHAQQDTCSRHAHHHSTHICSRCMVLSIAAHAACDRCARREQVQVRQQEAVLAERESLLAQRELGLEAALQDVDAKRKVPAPCLPRGGWAWSWCRS